MDEKASETLASQWDKPLLEYRGIQCLLLFLTLPLVLIADNSFGLYVSGATLLALFVFGVSATTSRRKTRYFGWLAVLLFAAYGVLFFFKYYMGMCFAGDGCP